MLMENAIIAALFINETIQSANVSNELSAANGATNVSVNLVKFRGLLPLQTIYTFLSEQHLAEQTHEMLISNNTRILPSVPTPFFAHSTNLLFK
jgi:hypothetical protein